MVRVEASVVVVGLEFRDSLSPVGSTNPGGNMFDTSSCMMGTAGDTLNPSRNMEGGSVVLGNRSKSSSTPAAVEMGKTEIPFSLVVANASELVSSSSSIKICGLSVSKSLDSCSLPKDTGLNLRLDGILVTGTSVGLVVFRLEVNWPGSRLSFLLGAELPDLLSSSSGRLLFSMSSSFSSSL